MQRVLVTGGTGLIGRRLVSALVERGCQVTVFTRNAARGRQGLPPSVRLLEWTPLEAGAWQRALAEQDAVFHLAGERAVGRRYTPELKQRLRDSRVVTTRLLVEGMRAASTRPNTFVCASGVGYYGVHHGQEPLAESAPPGNDFLAGVCVDWEREAEKAEALGVRVVRTRFGVVFGREADSLKLMALPFRLFAGGPIGDGEQVVSWVHISDVIRILLLCLDNRALSGPINVSAPEAVTNRDLSRTLARLLHRPSWLKAPKFGIKLVFGEGAEPILGGQRAVPQRLTELGYEFQYPRLEEALSEALG